MQNRYFRLPLLLIFSVTVLLAQIINAAPPTQWAARGPGGGGALFAPSFSPHNPNELFIACDMSEVFRSTNLGVSWNLLSFTQIQGNRESHVRFTSNPSILYALDCTSIGGADLTTPSRSTDGGGTWHRLTTDPTGGEAFTIFVDPDSTSKVLVSDYSRVFFSSDGGNTFAQKFSTASGNGCFVAGAFFDGNNIYVGTNLGLLVSTNGGSSFALSGVGGIPAAQAIASFTGAKQGTTTRFFCVTLNTNDVFPGLFSEAIYASYAGIYAIDWGQPNWTPKATGIPGGDYPVFVSMARGDISTAYVAGQQNSTEFPIIYKTTNGGNNWQNVLLTNNNQNIFTGWAGRGGDRDWSYGAGALGFAVSPNDANKVAFTDLGFTHLTTDGGASWKQAYVNPADQNPMGSLTPKNRAYRSVGLEDTSCWWLTWADANNMFASYSDIRGTRSTDGGNSWSFNYTGQTYNSTYQSIKHPTNNTLYVGTSSAHDMYQSTYLQDSRIDSATGEIKFSTDSGATWNILHNFSDSVIGLAIDPNNSNRMYASVIHSTNGGIYVSSNIQNGAASTWTKLANPPRTEGHPFNIRVLNDGTLVCTYSGRRNTGGTFTASSGVFVSTNGGTSWLDRSDAGMLYWTKDLMIDAHDATQSTWYVGVFSGWGGPPNGLGGLYKTVNRGINWVKISNLDRVTSCAISPTNGNELYLTTETEGLWYSSNINAATPMFTQLTSYPFRQPERVFFNPFNTNEIWVTSFGNGIRVGTSCTYTISPPSASFAAGGGPGNFSVTTQSGCNWTATTNDTWITINSGSGSDSGTVSYTVAANSSANPRSGTILVQGQFHAVNQAGASTTHPDTIGLFRPTGPIFYLRNSNTPGAPDISVPFGAPGDLGIVGDWDGNGTTTVGLYRPSSSTFYLRNSNTPGFPDITVSFGDGPGGDLPIVGDWNGDGTTTIGVYRPSTSTFYLRNTNSSGTPDLSIPYGAPGDKPVVGDWDGNGTTTIGLYRSSGSIFYLRNTNTIGAPDLFVPYGDGPGGDLPIVGDWDGNGTVTIGVYRPGGSIFYLRNSNAPGVPDLFIPYGAPGDKPVVGDWDGL